MDRLQACAITVDALRDEIARSLREPLIRYARDDVDCATGRKSGDQRHRPQPIGQMLAHGRHRRAGHLVAEAERLEVGELAVARTASTALSD
jgi:hypothetical protein